MMIIEKALAFPCAGDTLYGVLSLPPQPAARGVLIVVGGPQYRVGSHRQFTLLARELAACGIPVMRFDYRGMGDSQGASRSFEEVDEDLRCAVDQFMQQAPGLREVAIWGLCDAASAALFYAGRDTRVTGLALVNPWVRTEQGLAKTHLKHYYLRRLAEKEFWLKIGRGRFHPGAAFKSLTGTISQVLAAQRNASASPIGETAAALPARMLAGLQRFNGRVLLVLSGNDLTAMEFADLIKGSPAWQAALAARGTVRHDLAGANHTFSQRRWRDQLAAWTKDWLGTW